MRVTHVNLARGWRGGERQTLLLMQGLRDFGVESILVARAGEELARRAAESRIEVREIAKPFLLRGGKLAGSDVVHCHETRALQLAALWAGRNGAPLVVTRRVDFRPSASAFTRWKYKRADRIVAISEFVRDVMVDWGANPNSVSVVHSAIDSMDRSDVDTVARLRDRFHERKVIGCVAALVDHKDFPTLLRVAKRLQTARPDAVILVVGEGDLGTAIRAEAKSLGLNNIEFEGYQTDPYSYFRVFDVFMLTSKEEGLGTSVLDAFSYGVPVVATSAGGIPEMITDGETGVLCPIGDDAALAAGVEALLDDPERGKRLVERARARLDAEFSVPAMAAAYQRIYEEVTARASH